MPIFPGSPIERPGVDALGKEGEGSLKGEIKLKAGSNITLSQAGQTIAIHGASGGGGGGGGAIVASNTTFNLGTVSISGFGAATVNTAANLIRISVPVQTAETGISGISNSQTMYTSGTAILSEQANITINSSVNGASQYFRFSVAAQSVQTQGVPSMGVSTGGNTAGNTTVNSGTRFVFVGTNMVSLSEGTAANATTLTIDATQTVQTQGVPNMGVSTGGNTSGNTTVNSGTRFVLVGSNMVSLSQATAANATTISISATQTNQSAIKGLGVSNTGNTAGNTGVSTGVDWVIAASNNITASESTAAGGPNTVWISGPNAGDVVSTISYYDNMAPAGGVNQTALTVTAVPFNRIMVQPLAPYENYGFPGAMTVNTVYLQLSCNVSSSSFSSSISLGIYTQNNQTLLSLASSMTFSTAVTANANNSTAWEGIRFWSLTGTFNLNTGSRYWFGLIMRSSNAASASVFGQHLMRTEQHSGTAGVSQTTAVTNKWSPMLGIMGTGLSTALEASLRADSMAGISASANFMPRLVLVAHTSFTKFGD